TETCGNPILKAAMSPILDLVEPVADLVRLNAREKRSPSEQSEILAVMQAVKARDPIRARASMVNYMERFGRALEALDVEPPWLTNDAGPSGRGRPSPR
ncbi:MAG: FCD domain-containing protein, partial [Chloroflexi bacterium]|nr:FCD domain-containing protein [Chloroflexota bacterium]